VQALASCGGFEALTPEKLWLLGVGLRVVPQRHALQSVQERKPTRDLVGQVIAKYFVRVRRAELAQTRTSENLCVAQRQVEAEPLLAAVRPVLGQAAQSATGVRENLVREPVGMFSQPRVWIPSVTERASIWRTQRGGLVRRGKVEKSFAQMEDALHTKPKLADCSALAAFGAYTYRADALGVPALEVAVVEHKDGRALQ
jgi:hypothetical protein